MTFVINTYLYSLLYNIGLTKLATKLMTDEHKRLLTKVKPKLIKLLRLPPVLIHLQANDTFTDFHKQTIQSKRSFDDQRKSLIEILRTYPDLAFYKFKEALEETHQLHLAELLEEKEGPTAYAQQVSTTEAVASGSSHGNTEQLEIGSSNVKGT